MDVLIGFVTFLAIVVVVAWAAILVLTRLVGRVTINEYERGLRIERGRFVGLLDHGVHTYFRPTTQVLRVDSRPSATAVEGQEVMTSDGVSVKVSLVVRSVIDDPVARRLADQDPDRLLYLLVQLGLREVVAGRDLADVLSGRTTIGPAIMEIVASRMGELGIDLLSVDVRDVMVPAELKRAYAAVVAARQEGAAGLERARGETAALRSLANAGRLLEDHPGLLSLRMVQELGTKGGNTVVLELPDRSQGATAKAGRATRTTARQDTQSDRT
jgi:regulator of protease activity HflC (stomatin/prohibitin superfamily)